MQPATHEKGSPVPWLSDDERNFRASLEGLVDFYRVAQGAVLWRAFWPGTLVFLPSGSALMAVALSNRWVLGDSQLALVLLAISITAAGPLWALVTLLRAMRRDDRYVAIFQDGLRICLEPGQGPRRFGWDEVLDACCQGQRLTLSTTQGDVVIESRFAELTLGELAFRIRDAKRLALWGRLTRSALALARRV